MIGEFDLLGIFIPAILAYALLALALTALLRRLLTLAGLYRFVWHPALFDFALTVTLWGLVCAIAASANLVERWS
ncbi:DUF1656 domain-containing protein [Phenylobacterium sp.]|jgi:hypothetical protein|uniref:DUF1656 domain-containing protein n=1 Tax=Phenylobacterium sp. TaxID=1871053 RepID=UPI002F3EC020